jgi:response regulator RpfG family c-di-GMP phosphodiesterase
MAHSLLDHSHSTAENCPLIPAKKKPVVLCIDDDPDICQCLQIQLEHLGLEVQTALFGTHGYWDALVRRPHIIITDLRMPQGSGDYVIELLKRNPKTRNIPIIVLTGRRDPELKRYLTDMGIAKFFCKPLAFQELCDELALHIPLKPPKNNLQTTESTSPTPATT